MTKYLGPKTDGDDVATQSDVSFNTVLSGGGSPSSGVGQDGDFYIDTATSVIFGPKSAGSWGSPTSIVGPGLPSGGLEGQIISKIADSPDYATQWIDNYTGDLRIVCKNDSGSTIAKGKVVASVGSVGDRIKIDLADNDGTLDAKYIVGITSEEILNGTEGYVQMLGEVRNLNTNSLNVGDILYLDPNSPGGYTTTVPAAPSIDLAVAMVVKKNSSSGIIFVRVWSQGQKLTELYDVDVSTPPTTGQVLAYSGGIWSPTTIEGGGGGGTGSNAFALFIS